MKKRTAWILAAGVAAVAVGAAAVGALALLLRGGSGGLGADSYLSLRIAGDIPEQPPAEIESLFERHPPPVRVLVESLDKSARDPHVKAALLRIGLLGDAGWGKIQELRDAVTRFRRSGKPAYAHIGFCSNKEYYLATACTKVYAVPTALMDVTGLSAEVTFFKKTLDKAGIQAQFEGVGKYKNAPNRWTETGFTPPHREQTEALIDGIHEQYLEALVQGGRAKSREHAQALFDAGPYDGRSAKQAGLVDELLYEDQVEERLHEAESVSPGRYLRVGRGWFDSRPRVALVFAVGDIVPGESQSGPLGDGLVGSATVAAALRRAREDDAIRAVVLRIDSPGGVSTAADVIWREMKLTAKRKPLVASMGDVAASGGYYVATGADSIVAQPATITGSIGIFSGKFSLRGLYDTLGVTREIVTRGRHADLFTEYRPWNEEERAKVRSLNRAGYDDFVSKVAEGRKLTPEQVDALGQGRVWTGALAKEKGLVDALGGLELALSLATRKAGIPAGADVQIVVLPEPKGLLETLLDRQQDAGIAASLPADLKALLRLGALLREGPVARAPFEIRVR